MDGGHSPVTVAGPRRIRTDFPEPWFDGTLVHAWHVTHGCQAGAQRPEAR